LRNDRINDRYALLGGGVVQYGINNRRGVVNMADEAKLAEIMRELEKHVAAGEDIRIETAWRADGWRQYVIDVWPVQRKEGD